MHAQLKSVLNNKKTMNSIISLLRPNIRELVPYASARDEYRGNVAVFLDANENSFGSPGETDFNRYPDPLQMELKCRIAQIKSIAPENMFLGNGSDEAIDLVFRCFCEPGKDNVIICTPTYGMYEVSANINDVGVKKIPLTKGFQPDVQAILEAADPGTKLLFLCSPNNPTGNSFERDSVLKLIREFRGIVVLDEAYIDFASGKSFLGMLDEFPGLVLLQTFSKAWGLAGIRLGMAFASKEIIHIFNKVKPPYNINALTQDVALKALDSFDKMKDAVECIKQERSMLETQLKGIEFVQEVYSTDANFLLVKVEQADRLYEYLISKSIVVRNRSKVPMCEGCLRITVGTPGENKKLIENFKSFSL